MFGILTPPDNNPPCPSASVDPNSTVILEYSPAKTDENQVKDFARRWLDASWGEGSAWQDV